jgi:4-amino-4-deoxy-L-arabinose transferase-like glycosyltransferase
MATLEIPRLRPFQDRFRARLASRPRLAWGVFAIALLAWVVLVRGRFLEAGPINHDDAFYWMVGSAWRHGQLPYAHLWDLKPPGLFLLYAAADALFGADPAGVRLFAIVAVWIAGLAIAAFSTRRFRAHEAERAERDASGKPLRTFPHPTLAGGVGASLYTAYTLGWFGLACEPDLFFAALVAPAALMTLEAADRPRPIHAALLALAAGGLMGVAFTLKQTAALEGVFFFAYLAWRTRDGRSLLAYGVGAAVAPLAMCAYFAAHGLIGALWDAVVVSAVQRTGDGVTLTRSLVNFVFLLPSGAPLVLGAVVAGIERRRLAPSPPRRRDLGFLAGWTVVVCLGILAMHAALQYYFLPLLPPLCLLTGLLLARAARGRLRVRCAAVVAFVLTTAFPFLYFQTTMAAKLSASSTPRVIADYLRLVLDYEPYLYQGSGLRPVTRHPLPMQLVCPFPGLREWPEQTIGDAMAQRPDFLVTVQTHRRLTCELPERDSLALRLGGGDYRLDRQFEDFLSTIQVWRRAGG